MQVLDQQGFLKGGLGKLAEAEGTVDGLSKEADKQRAVLKVKQAEADDALVRIQASMMQVRAAGLTPPSLAQGGLGAWPSESNASDGVCGASLLGSAHAGSGPAQGGRGAQEEAGRGGARAAGP